MASRFAIREDDLNIGDISIEEAQPLPPLRNGISISTEIRDVFVQNYKGERKTVEKVVKATVLVGEQHAFEEHAYVDASLRLAKELGLQTSREAVQQIVRERLKFLDCLPPAPPKPVPLPPPASRTPRPARMVPTVRIAPSVAAHGHGENGKHHANALQQPAASSPEPSSFISDFPWETEFNFRADPTNEIAVGRMTSESLEDTAKWMNCADADPFGTKKFEEEGMAAVSCPIPAEFITRYGESVCEAFIQDVVRCMERQQQARNAENFWQILKEARKILPRFRTLADMTRPELIVWTHIIQFRVKAQGEKALALLDAGTPITAKPGSEDKVRRLAARYAAGIPLWDEKDCSDHGSRETFDEEGDLDDEEGPNEEELKILDSNTASKL